MKAVTKFTRELNRSGDLRSLLLKCHALAGRQLFAFLEILFGDAAKTARLTFRQQLEFVASLFPTLKDAPDGGPSLYDNLNELDKISRKVARMTPGKARNTLKMWAMNLRGRTPKGRRRVATAKGFIIQIFSRDIARLNIFTHAGIA